VIIGMHHNQDIRWMGGVRRYMPITWITALVGSLALIGTPFLSGFYSKDSIIIAVGASNLAGAGFATFAVTAGVFITAFYSFRMYFLVFHGPERYHLKPHDPHDHGDDHGHAGGGKPHESPWTVTLPLVLLAIPSVAIGYLALEPMVLGDWFSGSIFVDPAHGAMAHLGAYVQGPLEMSLHALVTAPFWLALGGVALAWFLYLRRPDLPAAIAARMKGLHTLLLNKYYLDEIYAFLFRDGLRSLGSFLWKVGDVKLIDGVLVNGSAWAVGQVARLSRQLQSGYLYTYAFTMLIGVLGLLVLWLVRTRAVF
jgi:NADH-quinone oxidoreductase subunit L